MCSQWFFSSITYLFIFGCVGSLLLPADLLYLWRVGLESSCGALPCHCGGFSRCRPQALGAQASVVATCGPSSCRVRALKPGLGGVECGLSCSKASGIFPAQGPNPCLLHWQAYPYPLYRQGGPSHGSIIRRETWWSKSFNLVHGCSSQRVCLRLFGCGTESTLRTRPSFLETCSSSPHYPLVAMHPNANFS